MNKSKSSFIIPALAVSLVAGGLAGAQAFNTLNTENPEGIANISDASNPATRHMMKKSMNESAAVTYNNAKVTEVSADKHAARISADGKIIEIHIGKNVTLQVGDVLSITGNERKALFSDEPSHFMVKTLTVNGKTVELHPKPVQATYSNAEITAINEEKNALRLLINGKKYIVHAGKMFTKGIALPKIGEKIEITGFEKPGAFPDSSIMLMPTSIKINGQIITNLMPQHKGMKMKNFNMEKMRKFHQ